MRKLVVRAVCILAVGVAACAPDHGLELRTADPLEPVKVHALAMAANETAPRPSVVPPRRIVRAPPLRRLTRRVYGYYPYWASGWQNLRLELLSTLAYFASPINDQGVITGSNGWGGAAVNQLVEAAKRAGTRVVTTITNFDGPSIGRLLASATTRDRAIDNIIAEIGRGGGEGVNIDFEFVPAAHKANFVTFMRELTRRMHDAIPGSEVTLATPSVDWGGAYDYDQLAIHTDGMMIMAYGYHWSGGSPGPLSPLRADAPWSGRSLTWSVDDYMRYGGAENRSKFILGLPFYGNDWPTTNPNVPGASRGRGGSIVYRAAAAGATRYGRRWDEASGGTPYYAYQNDGGWHQVWYDDAQSLGLKIDLINQRDLGGLGIWALGYDGDRPELFDVIEQKLSEPVVPSPVDGGAPDGGGDAGTPTDAGASDAGVTPDGGTRDAGSGDVDAGSTEPTNDAGVNVGGTEGGGAGAGAPPAGGGCASVPGQGGLGLLALALMMVFAAGRRRNR